MSMKFFLYKSKSKLLTHKVFSSKEKDRVSSLSPAMTTFNGLDGRGEERKDEDNKAASKKFTEISRSDLG